MQQYPGYFITKLTAEYNNSPYMQGKVVGQLVFDQKNNNDCIFCSKMQLKIKYKSYIWCPVSTDVLSLQCVHVTFLKLSNLLPV